MLVQNCYLIASNLKISHKLSFLREVVVVLIANITLRRCDLRFGSKRTEKFEITRGAAECDFKFFRAL